MAALTLPASRMVEVAVASAVARPRRGGHARRGQ